MKTRIIIALALLLALIPQANAASLVLTDTAVTLYGNNTYDYVQLVNSTINVAPMNATAGTGYLNITATYNITIDATSLINGTQRGYAGGAGGTAPNTCSGAASGGNGGQAGQGTGAGGNGTAGGTAEYGTHDYSGGGGGGGGGGASYASFSGNGSNGTAGVSYLQPGLGVNGIGGANGTVYGSASDFAYLIGSGAGGGGGGGILCKSSGGPVVGASGTNGRAGGAAIFLNSPNINILGNISAKGGNGGLGGAGGVAGGYKGGDGGNGSGASGGTILLNGTSVNMTGVINLSGGSGYTNGSGGRFKIFGNSILIYPSVIDVGTGTTYYNGTLYSTIQAYDWLTYAPISSFSANISNGTNSTLLSTTDGILEIAGNYPQGNINITLIKSGYQNLFLQGYSLNATSPFNLNISFGATTLLLCSGSEAGTIPVLNMSLLDEENSTAINGTIEITADISIPGETPRTNSFIFSNVVNASLCIATNNTYTMHAMLQYYATDYTSRTYFIDTNISNVTQFVNLYLLSSANSYSTLFFLRDEYNNPYTGAIIQVQRYFVGTNVYKTVAQCQSDYPTGKCATYMRIQDVYYRYIISMNQTVVRTTTPSQIVCTSFESITFCPPYPIPLSVSSQPSVNYFDRIGKVSVSVTVNNATNILSATVVDTSGTMTTSSLNVDKKGAMEFFNICNSTATSSATTFTCDLGNRSGNIYQYNFIGQFNGNNITLSSNILDYRTGAMDWGNLGPLMAFLIVATMFYLGIHHPVAALGYMCIGLVTVFLFGMTPLASGITTLIGVIIVFAIFAWKLK